MANKFLNGIDVTSTGSFTGQVTIPETPTADAHAASKKYVDDQITDGVDVAKRLEVTVKNISGGELTKGTVVHASPSANPPNGNVIEVVAADANDSTAMPALGILNETIADEAEGKAVMFGSVTGIDTSSFNVGDELYVSTTVGTLTETKPTAIDEQVQKIGVVIKSHASSGHIKVFGAGRSNDVPNFVERDITFGAAVNISSDLSAAQTIDYPLVISSKDDGNLINQLGGEGVGIKFRIAGNDATTPGNSLVGASIAAIKDHSTDTDSSTGLGFFISQNDETLDEALRINHDGKVGIGTTSPSYTLQVGDGTEDSIIAAYYSDGEYTQMHGYGLYMSRVASYIRPVTTTTQTLYVGSSSNVWSAISNSANTHYFMKGGAEHMRINSSGYVGIGTTLPDGKLTVSSGVDDTSLNTVRINHTRDNADVATQAMIIDMNLSGADTTTADRQSAGIYIDVDSSANGDASNEHRVRGITSDVRFTGFSDQVQSGYFYAESNNNIQKTAQLTGVLGYAVHDSSSVNGGVTNMYGVYGIASIQDLGDVDNAYGGFFLTTVTPGRGDADVGVTKGVEGKVSIDKAETINYGAMMAVSGIIDNNEGTVPTFGNQYLFKGDYQGTKGGNAYGIYTEGDKHYFDGNIGIGSTSPTSRLTVQENGITTKIATVTIGDTTAGASLTLRGGSPTIYFDRTGTNPENKILMDSAGLEFKTGTLDAEGDVDFKITADGDLQLSKGAKISNQENTDIDSAAAEVVAQVAHATYTAAFFDFVVKKGTNVRSGTVYACHNGDTTPLVEFTETSTNDLGDTSDVTLSVDISGTNMRLVATVTSDDWSVKSLIRAI
jgi:hypothetical protein